MVSKYYKKCKKKLEEEARERDQNISKEEKEEKDQYHRDQNKNLSEEERQKKIEHIRNYYLKHKK